MNKDSKEFDVLSSQNVDITCKVEYQDGVKHNVRLCVTVYINGNLKKYESRIYAHNHNGVITNEVVIERLRLITGMLSSLGYGIPNEYTPDSAKWHKVIDTLEWKLTDDKAQSIGGPETGIIS